MPTTTERPHTPVTPGNVDLSVVDVPVPGTEVGIDLTGGTDAPAPRRGRPRDPAASRAILAAARVVLARNGFTGTSMDEIARTAGVGKDTLYRRWNSKEALVRALLSAMADEDVHVPVEDDPSYALYCFLQDIVRLNITTEFGAIVAGVVGESARNDTLAADFRDFWTERRRMAGGLVRQIVGPDPDDGDVERFLDRVLGPIYYRLLLTGADIPDEYLWDLVISLPRPRTS